MAPKKPHSREKRALLYPRGVLAPEDFLVFVHWDSFVDDWEDLGLDDDDLRSLEVMIMAGPESGPAVSGTGGVRKLRFSPEGWATGKSSAIRVWYLYLKEHCKAILLVAYGKSERDNLTAGEKNNLKKLVQQIKSYLDGKGVNHGKA